MLIPKKNRKEVYQHLFGNGVLVAKKDFNLPRHPRINVPNLEVLKTMQSLESMDYVTCKFLWQTYFYTLTDKGIEFLRGQLNVPEDVVPGTLKPRNSQFGPRAPRPGACRRSLTPPPPWFTAAPGSPC